MKLKLVVLSLLFISINSFASEKDWEEAYSKIESQVKSAISGKALVSFSAYNVDENDIPINNLNDIVVSGKIKFVSPKGLWRDNTYISMIIENPTWLDITILANQMIVKTQNTHHYFLEDIEFIRKEKGVKIYDFVMGS